MCNPFLILNSATICVSLQGWVGDWAVNSTVPEEAGPGQLWWGLVRSLEWLDTCCHQDSQTRYGLLPSQKGARAILGRLGGRVWEGGGGVGNICGQIWERGQLCTQCQILALFRLSPFQSSRGLWLYSWFIGTSGLLLHISHIWSFREPPVRSCGRQTSDTCIKRPIFDHG